MAHILERVTTVFSPEEDRIRIAGARQDGQQVVIWVTRRLLGFLLPHLLQRLDGQFASTPPELRDTMQEFAQQTARSALGESAPVVAAQDDEVLLASAIDIGQTEVGVLLTFRDGGEKSFSLPLASENLRQWLHILYQADRAANWQLPQWPAWLTGETGAAGAGSSLSLH
ncbi:hypothetical protein [Pseudoduganella sp.]|uniref:hypothetical protein n=1 Tax=Pseudoduganella sp. TaxID=1880898 RepID=UPI0035B0DDFA